MATDLACKPCKGTGEGFDCPVHGFVGHHEVRTDKTCPRPISTLQQCQVALTRTQDCPGCVGSGVAAWAVEAGVTIMVGAFDRPPITAKIEVQTVLAAVREEAKNQ